MQPKTLKTNSALYWDYVYKEELQKGKLRKDPSLTTIVPLLQNRNSILDFGSGPGGNVLFLTETLKNKHFTLLDHSNSAIDHAKSLLKNSCNKNTFSFSCSLSEIIDKKFDAVLMIEVLEHIKDYSELFQILWDMVNDNGSMIISVPVKGWRDRHREHINKFTIKSMFQFLSRYSSWVNIGPRTYSKKSGILSTAFFHIEKRI